MSAFPDTKAIDDYMDIWLCLNIMLVWQKLVFMATTSAGAVAI